MKILITNNTLSSRAGTELYVRDIAKALRDRGHQPAAYSNLLGDVAEEICQEGIPVVDDLNNMPWKPDIIHCHHHLEAMTALFYFPNVPAVYFCHGWRPWQEISPIHPRLFRYVAVDEPTRDFMISNGVPQDLIRIILNFVDLQRFKPRGHLPDKPARALLFSNYASEETHLPAVREACARKGIFLDVAGIRSGNPIKRPEEVLGSYDLIFAKARAALESLAVGTSVILCDEPGVGPMVSTENLNHLRILNFGAKTLSMPLSPEVLINEIERYNPSDAKEASRRIRSVAGIDEAMDSIISLYEEVIERFSRLNDNKEGEAYAAAKYLRWLSTLVKDKEIRWAKQYALLSHQHKSIVKECTALKKEIDTINNSFAIRLKNNLRGMPVLGQMFRFLFFFIKTLLRKRI